MDKNKELAFYRNRIIDSKTLICTLEFPDIQIRNKTNGGTELKCAFLNINGAPHEFKNLEKSIEYEKLIKNNDVITLLETGHTKKLIDKTRNDINII